MPYKTASFKIMLDKIEKLYEQIVNSKLLIRRITIVACNLSMYNQDEKYKKQISLFDYEETKKIDDTKDIILGKTILNIKKKYGKNAIIKGMNLMEGATTIERNNEIGGHHA